MSEQVVKAKLEVKDVAGDTYSNEYNLPVSEGETSAEVLQDYNSEIKSAIEEDHWFHRFDEAIQTQNIVWYKVTRMREGDSE